MSGGSPLLLLILGVGICSALLAVIVNTVFNFRAFRRVAPAAAPVVAPIPLVSVLVPARNEERTITDCLVSLQAQTWPDIEIILLDDQSDDTTAERVRELGFGDSGRCRIIAGRPLPEGWVGKCWACHQLAAEARGEVLIFTDADTIHSPESVATAIAVLRGEGASLLSLWPRQTLRTWSEKLVIPLGYVVFMGLLPLALFEWIAGRPALARRLPRRQLAGLGVSNGQYLVFERAAYDTVGGHAALRGHLVEDVAFGRKFAARSGDGLRVINRDGSRVIQCRMYASFRSLWEGFSKNLRPAFDDDIFAYCFSGVLLFTLFVLPFGLVWVPGPSQWWFVGACGLVMVHRATLTARFGTGWLSVVLHPIGMLLALTVALNSWRWSLSQSLRWKGRRYSSHRA